MTMTTATRRPLPAETIFYGPGCGGEQYSPGWRTNDWFNGWMTLGHVDAAGFNRRISPQDASGIEPDTIKHEWVVLSYHAENCTGPLDPDDDDPSYCCGMVKTGWEDETGRPVYVHDATADTPGAIAVTWGYPQVPQQFAGGGQHA